MKKFFLSNRYYFVTTFVVAAVVSCNKEYPLNEVGSVSLASVFQPSHDVKVVDGMLSFESKIAFDVTKLEIANADRKSVDLWEQSLGIKTAASIFYAVIKAEDSVSNYYESLPAEEQEYWLKQPEVHSEIYLKALNNNIIKVLPDGEGGEYFDINLFDETTAGVVNTDGLVMVEGQIHQYTSNAVKVLLNGDTEKVEKLKSINKTFEDDEIVVMLFDDSVIKDGKSVYGNNWTQHSGWKYPSNRRRVKVWIDGHSEKYGNIYEDNCTERLNCTFTVKVEAQKKNFWGNWKYTDYAPSLSYNAQWTYSYRDYSCDSYITYGCGLYDCVKYSVPAYSCTPNPNYMCPTSPHTAYYPSVNKATLALTPHGIWTSRPKFFSDAFTVNGSLSATIDGKLFNYSW